MSRRRALLSVSDKSGIEAFARGLADRGWQLLSTGGTARTLREAGLPVTDVAEITRHPEMMDGRVKTLHPAVHAGILARRDRPDDLEALESAGYAPIDLVAVNLYPFRETVASGGVPVGRAMEKVDIGGPTMIRAAAKNHADVWVVVEPADYGRVLAALDEAVEGPGAPGAGAALRRELAARVFRHISTYDAAVADYLAPEAGGESAGDAAAGAAEARSSDARPPNASAAAPDAPDPNAPDEAFPPAMTLRLERVQSLRYGENPDQEAAFYTSADAAGTGIAALKQLHGKELSYNNILDLDGALLALAPFAFSWRPAVCIVKHTTPAGLAVGRSLLEAYQQALRTDPVSAFGSVITMNRPVDETTANAMSELFIECIVAPSFSKKAIGILTQKKSLRLLTMPAAGFADGAGEAFVQDVLAGASNETRAWWSGASAEEQEVARFLALHGRFPTRGVVRSVYGGVLAQHAPIPPFYGTVDEGWTVPTRRQPTEREWDDLRFAWAAVAGVKSNAILLACYGTTLGIGAGQMSRVDSSRLAVQKAEIAGLDLAGAVLASDAFFPFRDGVDAAAKAGVRAIVQPGGSIRDEEVIAAADQNGIAMALTGRRLFRH